MVIKLQKRYKYAGDIYPELIKLGFDKESAEDFLNGIKDANVEERVYGEWIETSDENKKRCSRCDVIHLIAQYPNGNANYCPNCGAKMDGVRNNVK